MKYILTFSLFESRHYGNMGSGILPYCDETKRFLVGLRSQECYEPHTWGLFGGKSDDDDADEIAIQQSAIRELEEETKYDGDIKLLKGVVFKDNNFEYHNYVGIVSEEFEPILNWENDKAKWITYEQLLKLTGKHFGLKYFLDNSKNLFSKLK